MEQVPGRNGNLRFARLRPRVALKDQWLGFPTIPQADQRAAEHAHCGIAAPVVRDCLGSDRKALAQHRLGGLPMRLLQQTGAEPGKVAGQNRAIGPLNLAAAGQRIVAQARALGPAAEGFIGGGESDARVL